MKNDEDVECMRDTNEVVEDLMIAHKKDGM